ncbi:hypothetical protein [Sinorhizobium medicae]|uniref:hypothetical protein n=1 Tax=Sinorhizobium medicae TaxID=110321 RepID=UPI00138FFADC|nr:hypothetical protein [Sinorhizobium medicae]
MGEAGIGFCLGDIVEDDVFGAVIVQPRLFRSRSGGIIGIGLLRPRLRLGDVEPVRLFRAVVQRLVPFRQLACFVEIVRKARICLPLGNVVEGVGLRTVVVQEGALGAGPGLVEQVRLLRPGLRFRNVIPVDSPGAVVLHFILPGQLARNVEILSEAGISLGLGRIVVDVGFRLVVIDPRALGPHTGLVIEIGLPVPGLRVGQIEPVRHFRAVVVDLLLLAQFAGSVEILGDGGPGFGLGRVVKRGRPRFVVVEIGALRQRPGFVVEVRLLRPALLFGDIERIGLFGPVVIRLNLLRHLARSVEILHGARPGFRFRDIVECGDARLVVVQVGTLGEGARFVVDIRLLRPALLFGDIERIGLPGPVVIRLNLLDEFSRSVEGLRRLLPFLCAERIVERSGNRDSVLAEPGDG